MEIQRKFCCQIRAIVAILKNGNAKKSFEDTIAESSSPRENVRTGFLKIIDTQSKNISKRGKVHEDIYNKFSVLIIFDSSTVKEDVELLVK